jgi:Bacterial SH3 domain
MYKNIIGILTLLIIFTACQTTPKKAPETTTIAVPSTYTAFVVRDKINMRQEATAQSKKIKTVNNGDEVQVLQNKDGWYQVITMDNEKGWIRSDFVGTRDLSYARLVTDFVESAKAQYETEFFIDQSNPYAVIYLVLPKTYYDDKASAREFAQAIGLKYQEAVYPGRVEIRIMNPDKKKLFTRRTLSPIGPVGLKAPFIRYGRLHSFKRINGDEIKINILVPTGLNQNQFLKMAEDISSRYGDNISKIEIYFVENSGEGIRFFEEEDYSPSNKKICRFYYIEDAQGMDYKADFCD